MDDRDILLDALKFHGHRCWASVAGVRCGLAALRTLGVQRSGGTQLYAILETGEEHGGMCYGDGVQYTTGCTFGKGNIRKEPRGKLAFTLIDKDSNRAVRVSLQAHAAKANRRLGLHAAARGRLSARRDPRGRPDGVGGPGVERAGSRHPDGG